MRRNSYVETAHSPRWVTRMNAISGALLWCSGADHRQWLTQPGRARGIGQGLILLLTSLFLLPLTLRIPAPAEDDDPNTDEPSLPAATPTT